MPKAEAVTSEAVVLQDQDGDYYFLRPEILEAAKVPKNLRPKVEIGVKAAARAKKGKRQVTVVGSFKVEQVDDEPNIEQFAARGVAVDFISARKPGPPIIKKPQPKPNGGGTIMCPW